MKIFVARQPIFDRKQSVIAYELLFRDGLQDACLEHNDDRATSSVLAGTFALIGLETLTQRKPAFIKFTRNLLIDKVPHIFPKELLGIEISKKVATDTDIIKACKELKRDGYLMVFDDFLFERKYLPFIELADIIKIAIHARGVREKRKWMEGLHSNNTKLLAKKVETKEEFERAKELAFDCFQGNFFREPETVSGHDIPGYKMTYLQLLREVNKPEVDFNKVERLIKCDMSLSYKLLRLINSVAFGLAKNIKSIKHALVMLGIWEARKWISLIALSGLAEDKPSELIVSSLLRAKFCESLAPKLRYTKAGDLFLMGLFSMIDSIIDRPKFAILKDLPLSEKIKTALLGGNNPYRDVLDLVIGYESGEWDELSAISYKLSLEESCIPELYIQSVKWTSLVFRHESERNPAG